MQASKHRLVSRLHAVLIAAARHPVGRCFHRETSGPVFNTTLAANAGRQLALALR